MSHNETRVKVLVKMEEHTGGEGGRERERERERETTTWRILQLSGM